MKEMSWDSYIDNLIAQTKDVNGVTHCDKACIIGLDGSYWTSTDHPNAVKLQPGEVQNIARCFRTKDFTPFMVGMVQLEGTSHTFIKEEDGKIVYARFGQQGYTLQASKTAIIIARCPVGCQQGNVNKGVNVIAEYLESLGM